MAKEPDIYALEGTESDAFDATASDDVSFVSDVECLAESPRRRHRRLLITLEWRHR